MENILNEKYRPSKIDDLVLESELKQQVQSAIDKAKNSNPIGLPNFIFEGNPGTGKTSCAKTLCLELNLEHLFLNCGIDLSVDALKHDIKQFAETMSTYDFGPNGEEVHRKKVVILDEADALAKQSNSPKILKSFIEMYSNNCTFIFTCNNFNTITNDPDVKEALKSRCQYLNFNINNKTEFQKQIFKRVCNICDTEKFQYDKKNIAEIIKHYGTDIRKIINFIDGHYYELTKENLIYLITEGKIDELFKNIREKDFVTIRKFLTNTDMNLSQIFYEIFNYCKKYVENPNTEIPKVVLITERFMDNYTRAIHPEITMTAYLLSLAFEVKWKK